MTASPPPRSISPEEMGRLDRIASEQYGIPSLLLMENAGFQAFSVLEELANRLETPASTQNRVSIFCGRGNNGGDGLVVARHAFNAGWQVRVYLMGEVQALDRDGDPGRNLTMIEKMGVEIHEILESAHLKEAIDRLQDGTLVVDSILGTGLRGPARGLTGELIAALNASGRTILAVDVPSGLDAATGEAPGDVVRAHSTVTFALAKDGLLQGRGPEFVGDLVVVPISIPRQEIEAALRNT